MQQRIEGQVVQYDTSAAGFCLLTFRVHRHLLMDQALHELEMGKLFLEKQGWGVRVAFWTLVVSLSDGVLTAKPIT